MRLALTAGAAGLLAVPALAVLTALSIGAATSTCLTSAGGTVLAADAPVPASARQWISATVSACPQLPEVWVAAVMAQESGFRPDAYVDDANGGTWGLFQLNASIWATTYGHPWSADLDGNGIWDVKDPLTHASVAGRYFCGRLDGVRALRAAHPDWASTASLSELDALIVAHNAGESRLRTYPTLPDVTQRFIAAVRERTTAWGTVPLAGGPEPTLEATGTPVPATATPLPAAGTGCLPTLGTSTDTVVVPAGTPVDVATAVRNGLAYVGVAYGWTDLCDRLACRAYGYVGSGYTSAATHWATMLATGHAHPDDPCPPLGAFVFYDTGRIWGHVSLVVQASATCDPEQIKVTSNEVFDTATGNRGGVYLLSFARLNGMYRHGGYLGWSDPVCQGALLPAGTVHPAPSGR